MKFKLEDICSYYKKKVEVSNLTLETYVSTENMLPNKIGVVYASSLPSTKSTQAFEEGDILVSNIRPYFKKIWKAKFNGGCSNDVLVFKANENIDSDFLYYVLADDAFFTYAMASSKGTKMPRGDKTSIMQYEVPDYDVSIQKKIARILKRIDDKIELNNKINNNLEEQARALFRNFVDNSSKTDKISIEDIVLTANTGADAIRKAPIVDHDTGIRCVRVGDMSNKRSFHDWGYAKVTKEVFDRYQLRKNDIIVTRTASLGLNMIVPDDLQAVYNNGLIRLSIDSKKALPLFIYRQIQTQDFSNYIARIESETSVRPNMKINYLLKYNFDLPSLEEQYNLINLLQPMIESQTALITENNGLNKLRDTLLPKLMSGEIDVSNISI
ncbi:restriction endonuclease subunit S [Fenollaria timonensis]|uniref:restriction endonuclease subunit S n=1 Tax=Fenollaria timonensis TaxID=1723384 RepID=UPI0026F1466D|nr:restriction endonuclease subunit S [Fenollaria timonensis]